MDKVIDMLYDRLRGTPDDTFTVIDQLIEDGDIDKEFFQANESAILAALDNQLFQCECCSWNCESSEMSTLRDWTCIDCCDGEEDD